jgi:hypothetical protein
MTSFCDIIDGLCKNPLCSLPSSPSSSFQSPSFPQHTFLELTDHIGQARFTGSLPVATSPTMSAGLPSQQQTSAAAFLDLVQRYSQLYEVTHGTDDSERSSDTEDGSSFMSDLDQGQGLPHLAEEDEDETQASISREYIAS